METLPATVVPSGPPDQKLEQIASFVREALSRCARAFQEFNLLRFQIGLCLMKAREILAIKTPNPTGRNQYSDGRPGNYQAEDAGLMAWCKAEFSDIPYRTLTRYRQWVELEALPKLRECWSQLELPLDDPQQLDVLSIPAGKRDLLAAALKRSVTGRDVTLTLRAMGEADGDPDRYGPKGGDVTPRDPVTGKRIQRKRGEAHAVSPELADATLRGAIRAIEAVTIEILARASDELAEQLEQARLQLGTVLRDVVQSRRRPARKPI